MADIDKAITFDEQVELNVRDRTKGMEIEVDITEENPDFDSFEELEDGNIVFGEPMPQEEEIDFYENLAEVLDDSDLSSLKNDLMGSINSDKESRSDWEKNLPRWP
jgi:flavodoxin